MATNVYVDAFNLYDGCLKGTPYRWLDLSAHCRRLLPKDRINRIRYFTATISARPDNPDAPQRQQVCLRALETIPWLSLHYGHYLSHVTRMPLAHPRRGGARTVEVVKSCAARHSRRANSRPCSRTPKARSTSRRAGRTTIGARKRRDPPKRASHPTAEAAGGIWR
jgi:hypothetical protein